MKLRFKLTGAWPVSPFLIESGTIIEGDSDNLQWNGVSLPALPINAMALSQESYDFLCLAHPDHLHHLQYASGVQPRTAADMPAWRSELAKEGTNE